MATVTQRFRRRKLASLMLVVGVAMMLLAPATGAGANHVALTEHCPDKDNPNKVEVPYGSNSETDTVVVDGTTVKVVIVGDTVTFFEDDDDPETNDPTISVEFCMKAADLAGGKHVGSTGTVWWENNGGQIPGISYVIVYTVPDNGATTTEGGATTTEGGATTTEGGATTTQQQATTTQQQATTTQQQATTTQQQATTTEQAAGTTVVQTTTTEQQATTTEAQATTTEAVAGTTLVQSTTTEAEAAGATVKGNVLERELAATGIATEAWLLAAGLTLGLGGLLLLLGDKDRHTE